jgi:hypothetical protein
MIAHAGVVAALAYSAKPNTSFLHRLSPLQVLDAEDADVLLQLLALQQQSWDPNQLAAALTAGLPCLRETAPSGGDALAVLFAAVGAAAGGMNQQAAGQLLVVLAQLPGYAPDPKVRKRKWCLGTYVLQ